MTATSRAITMAVIMLAAAGSRAAAQGSSSGQASARGPATQGRYEAAVGVEWLAPSSLGTRAASLTTSAGAPLTLFNTSTRMTAAAGLEARLAYHLRRQIDVEAFGAFAKPSLDTTISNDFEGAAGTNATDTLKQYVIGGSVVFYLPDRFDRGSLRPFVIGSAAYVRQLHNADTLAVNGQQYEAGVGVKYPLRVRRDSKTGRLRTFGIRAEARVRARIRGVEFDDRLHFGPALTASAFYRF